MIENKTVMENTRCQSILKEAIILRFGFYYYNKYFIDDGSECFFSFSQEKELLDHFKIDGYFLDHPLFDPYREQEGFQKFFGAFYCSSTLDLLLKFYLLREILKQASVYGFRIFHEWTGLFQSCYNTDLITKRNIEMEAFLSLSRNTNKSQ